MSINGKYYGVFRLVEMFKDFTNLEGEGILQI